MEINGTVTRNRSAVSMERIILAVVWGLVGVGILYWAARDAWTLRFVLLSDLHASTPVLAAIAVAGIAGILIALSLVARWRYAALLVNVITYPLTVFAAWAVAWGVVALLASSGMTAWITVLVPMLALVVMHRTRRVARDLRA